jgi:hypothetical protein
MKTFSTIDEMRLGRGGFFAFPGACIDGSNGSSQFPPGNIYSLQGKPPTFWRISDNRLTPVEIWYGALFFNFCFILARPRDRNPSINLYFSSFGAQPL